MEAVRIREEEWKPLRDAKTAQLRAEIERMRNR